MRDGDKHQLDRAGVPSRLLVGIAAIALTLPAAASAAPNVLVVVTDDQRTDGTMQVLPTTQRWLFQEGTQFPNAVATTPLCCPSRVSMLTGQYAHNHRVWKNSGNAQELAALQPDAMLQGRLRAAGYRTGIVGKYLNGWPLQTAPPRFDHFEINGGQYFNTTWNRNGQLRPVSEYSTTFTGKRAAHFIRDQEASDTRPWFLWVAPFAPHGSFGPDGVALEPEPKYADAPVGEFTHNPASEEDTPEELADKPPFWRNIVSSHGPGTPGHQPATAIREGQLRLLLSVDDMVKRIRKAMAEGGEAKDTLVVFVSDNGLLWGEHGDVSIKDMPWSPSIEIPLALRWPGHFAAGGEDSRTAANIDLAPTILEAAGIALPPTMDGRSLLSSWDRQHVLIEYGGLSGSVSIPPWIGLHAPGEYQYTEYYGSGPTPSFREHYDLAADPWQVSNPLANPDPGDDPPVADLSVAVKTALACVGATCP